MDSKKEFARELRRNLTDAERKLWKHIRRRQVNNIKFRRQQRIGSYVVDFFAAELKLIVELDDGQHAENYMYDEKCDSFLRREGYQVLRFWNHDVMKNVEEVLEVIHKHCQVDTPTYSS